MCFAVALLPSSFFAICLTPATDQLMLASDNCENCDLAFQVEKYLLTGCLGFLVDNCIKPTAFGPDCTTHPHLIKLLMKDLKSSYLTISSFTCGLKNNCHSVHYVTEQITLGSKYKAWYILVPGCLTIYKCLEHSFILQASKSCLLLGFLTISRS